MLNFIDTSNWQCRYNPALTRAEAVIVKATEGTGYVDPYCDLIIQQAMDTGMPWGFYHFAGEDDATSEAAFYLDNCRNYFGHGIPVLDWEGNQGVEWVNAFVEYVHAQTGVWPWIYATPWRFNQGSVNTNCARWVASYRTLQDPRGAKRRAGNARPLTETWWRGNSVLTAPLTALPVMLTSICFTEVRNSGRIMLEVAQTVLTLLGLAALALILRRC